MSYRWTMDALLRGMTVCAMAVGDASDEVSCLYVSTGGQSGTALALWVAMRLRPRGERALAEVRRVARHRSAVRPERRVVEAQVVLQVGLPVAG